MDSDKLAALRWAAPALVIAAAAGAGALLGPGPALLILAAGALALVIWLFWMSLQSLTGEAPLTLEEALSMAAPSAEEERKRAVLRALKDLEFERSVGKISEEDYRELAAGYRAEARRLLRALDEVEEPARQRAERLLAKRLKRKGITPAKRLAAADTATGDAAKDDAANDDAPKDDAANHGDRAADAAAAEHDERGDDDERRADKDERELPEVASVSDRNCDDADDDDADDDDADDDAGDDDDDAGGDDEPTERDRACPECATVNDSDARFCKSCGHRFESEASE